MTQVELTRMIVDEGNYEHQLQIGHRDIRRRPEKRTGSGVGGGDEAGTFVPPFEHRACDLFSSSPAPMPESCRTCGEPKAPPAKITSRRARTSFSSPPW